MTTVNPPPSLPTAWTTARLRPRPFDRDDVDDVLAYATDRQWGRFLPVPDPYGRADAEAFLEIQVAAEHATAPRWALQLEGAAWADVRNVGSWRVMEKVGLRREGIFRSVRVVHGERVDDVRYAILRPEWETARARVVPEVEIRRLGPGDPAAIATAFGGDRTEACFARYLEQQARDARVVLVAEAAGRIVGYVSLVWTPQYPPFADAGIPAIEHFHVDATRRRRGIGTALLDAAEALAFARADTVGIGVGMDPDDGPAQAMYARRGYVPDARGLTSHQRYVRWGEDVRVDDDLVLFLTKSRR